LLTPINYLAFISDKEGLSILSGNEYAKFKARITIKKTFLLIYKLLSTPFTNAKNKTILDLFTEFKTMPKPK
jgi:hypothetical protein